MKAPKQNLIQVVLINTSDNGGGAAVACTRLLNALLNKVGVNLLVQYKKTISNAIAPILTNTLIKLLAKFNFFYERLSFIAFYEKSKMLRFAFSTANAGINISNNKLILHANLLHIHWVNQGFLSIKNLKQLLLLNKPVVFTLHDMWAFTGGCHYAGTCTNFMRNCGDCKFLKTPAKDDISKQGWLAKQNLFKQNNKIVFVACSNWLAQIAQKSSLLQGFKIIDIPNPINTTIYKPLNQVEIRKKRGLNPHDKVVLFGAANINDERKGIIYLIEALKILKLQYPNQRIQIVLFGKNNLLDTTKLPFTTKALPLITCEQDLVEIYNLAHVFVLPSLEDNLPNMVIEALACGVPVVAFNQGGIPEIIDHKQNGYVAKYKNAEDFAEGINWVLNTKNLDLKTNARQKVLANYSEELIAQKYIQVYQSLLNQN